jgi:hypothetical protein
MLTAEQRELVAAAVDGELSATDNRALCRLLDASAEARDLYAKLNFDSQRVRVLQQVQVPPPADLRAKVMARIAAATPAPLAERAPAARPRRSSPWMPAAVAAALLLAVTLGAFAYKHVAGGSDTAAVKQPWSDSLPAPQRLPSALPAPNDGQARPRPQPDPDSVAHSDATPVPPLPLPTEVLTRPLPLAPEPRPAQHDFLTAPLLPPLRPFDLIQVRVPFLHAVSELGREDVRQDLSEELSRDPARIDLFVRDTARGVDVFRNAAKAAGLHVFADAGTLDKLKKRQVHAVVVYVECLTRDELADLFGRVSAADTKFTPRVCDSLHATAVVRSDETELKAILGQDVGLFKRPQANPAGQGGRLLDKNGDPKSVSSGTIDTVTKTLTSPAKPGEKNAVLMTWQTAHTGIPRTSPSASSELKQFLAKRGDRRSDAVPAIIVIRPAG